MKTIFFICFFSLLAVSAQSQPETMRVRPASEEDARQASRQRVQAHRVAFFTEKLALTPAEAERFWPLYNAFRNERDRLNSETIQRTHRRRGPGEPSTFDVSELSDAEARRLVNNKAQQIELERQFHQDLTRLFSPQRVLAFYEAERRFQRELMNMRTRAQELNESRTR